MKIRKSAYQDDPKYFDKNVIHLSPPGFFIFQNYMLAQWTFNVILPKVCVKKNTSTFKQTFWKYYLILNPLKPKNDTVYEYFLFHV